jgi:hypothetical protein
MRTREPPARCMTPPGFPGRTSGSQDVWRAVVVHAGPSKQPRRHPSFPSGGPLLQEICKELTHRGEALRG